MNFNRLKWFYLAGFFLILALPILNLPPWFSPPAWGQTIVFRSLMAVLLFVFLAKQGINVQNIKEVLNTKSRIFFPFWSLLAFFFAVFLSTLFSLDISNSLWGSPARGGGFINLSFYVLFCVLGFLIIKDKNWKKLLDFSLLIGCFAALIAVFQQFGVLSHIFVSMESRPSSTMGNTIIFSLYLLPLLFLALSFFILEKNRVKKLFYLFCLLFFLFTIIAITQTRAAFLGLLVGFFWFLIAYPKKMKVFKIGVLCFFVLLFLSFFFLNNNPQIYEKWHPLLKNPVSRITTLAKGLETEPARISVWKISMRAFLEKPYLGYGPENFSIAFDKHYDPLLPVMQEARWFDRAHNSLVEILITSGVFALIFYLFFFFSLFWNLQRIKKECPISHGLQSAFLAFLTASFSSIEGFSTFLVFFFLSAYSLFLLSDKKDYLIIRRKTALYFFLFLPVLAWFLLNFNFKPFQINTRINMAQDFAKEKNWKASFEILEKESQRKSFLLPYLNFAYSKLLIERILEAPEEKIRLSEKIAEILDKNTKIQPYYTRNWLYFGESLSVLAKEKQDPELAQKARNAFEKALELSPKDPSIILRSFLAVLAVKDFEKAKEKSDYCLKIYPDFKECCWLSGLINIYLNDIEKGKDFIEKAKEKGYPVDDEVSLNQLIEAFAKNENYREIAPLYENLIKINPSQVQYKTSLAFVYRELGDYEKTREEALKILKTNPELKESVEEFLKTLR